MSNPVWFRSLYWRIAFGFIALLAVLLVAQGFVFLWLTGRVFGEARTPAELAEHVAQDIGQQLARDRATNLEAYVPERFSSIFQPFIVVTRDGRLVSNKPDALPQGFHRGAQGRMRGTDGPWRDGGGRGGRGRAEYAPIVVNGTDVGVVSVPGSPPPIDVMLRMLAPTLIWVGAGLLAFGATVTALLIFRPTHKRLRTLEHAATALGEGRTDVRASENGGDEVSSLARTFNRMAADLESRAAALAESDRVRRQLLADVSHELMTPLTAIRGWIETLTMKDLPIDGDTRQRYLGIVEHETHKLEAIIGDLLDLARLEGGGETLATKPVRVADLFTRVADRHEPTVRDKKIALDLDVAPGTPEALGDAARLEQAVQNVAANAIRHTPEGGRVTLRAEPAAEGVRILVRDTGPGIPVEQLARVFDRFYKVDASRSGTALQSGSGLGLSIVQAIIERHGGRVKASNAPEGGAVFELLLPAAASH